MDDVVIYDDLENYNDLNVIEELRNENKQLKFKVEEYSTSLAKLQKDYDKLTSEFKIMEINFSSLLKTSRAEIERKTQIITNLNMEKDTMVLNSIQNSNKSIAMLRRNMVRDRSNNRKLRKETEVDAGKPNKSNDYQEIKKYELERDKNEDKRLPSVDTVSSGQIEEANKIDSKLGKESFGKSSESKENIKGKRPQSLRNRRKSMPVASKHANFSSDEEYEANCSGEDINNKKEWPARDDKSRRHPDRHSHKISETSGIDEKYSSYHESSRETYYKGKSHRHSDKYRSTRDRYDSTQRHKRYYSPERSRRSQRDYLDDPYQRQEYARHRVLESPPVEKYDTQRRYRDRRVNYEKDDPNDERYRNREERVPAKHKLSADYEEPAPKRVRTDSSTKPAEEEVRRQKDYQTIEDKRMPEFSDHLQQTSCQSPDYTHPDVLSAHPVKEIMSTAEIKLEDPRFTSKRYIKKPEGHKVTLLAADSGNIDLKVIDTSTWDIPRVDVPEALQIPPHYTDETVRDLYMDIDNPVSNMSTESGSNVGPITDYVTESFFQDYENERLNQENIRLESNKMQEHIKLESNMVQDERKEDSANMENQSKSLVAKYKIPKVKKPDKDEKYIPNPLGILLQQLQTACGADTTIKVHKSKLDVDKTFGTDDVNSQDNKSKDASADNETKQTHQAKLRTRRKMSTREIIEGDLALSDETSDNIDVQKPKVVLKEQPENSREKSVSVIEKPEENEETLKKHKTDIIVSQDNIEKIPLIDKTEICPDIKIKKTKKKSQKKKREKSEETKNAVEKEKVPEKKTKVKKEREHKVQERKAKFTDLFGESSSLITPEDLGVALVQTQTEPTIKYVPIFEDAQDADDVNVKALAKAQDVPETENGTKLVATLQVPEVISKPVETTKTGTTPYVPEGIPETSKQLTLNREVPDENEVCVSVKETTQDLFLNTEVIAKEPDVVKTVIISTGVQPRIDSIEPNICSKIAGSIENTQPIKAPTSKLVTKVQNVSSALATSTPYKKHLVLETEIESSCTSSENGILRDDTSSVDQSSVSNGIEPRNDDDVPDVRIFVRRRRKVKK
ncbi:uncharacterized protein DDB_G0283697-like isoform X2 [Pectinophora gossypiella]|uniref:Uncharacterized protein n=1 Tax=Pectinophora gossypiella TaxID=13191 RepID=A0A1E1W1C6_PECGO|nr:uncharacterized protein DDB_G0283697-like isoform X2 [Pectinophora gossypiella]